MFRTLAQQFSSYLLAQRPQRVPLLIVNLRPPAHGSFGDLAEPLRTIAWCVHALACAGNRPASEKSLQAIHHPRDLPGQRQVATGQLFQGPYAVLCVVDRGEKSGSEKIGQLSSIDPVILVPRFQQGVFPRIAHQHFCDVRLEQFVQPRRASSFFQGHMHASAQSVDKLQDRCCFRFDDGLHHQLAGRVQNRSRDRCLVHIQPNILNFIQHEGAPSCRR